MQPDTREATKAKMAQVFGENLASFPQNVREDLIDDMVTAFESREAVWQEVLEKQLF